MNTSDNRISILIQGATGQLGTYITKHALANPKLLVNIMVRDPSKNKELVSQVESAGGKVIKADLTDKESLKDITKGIHTVICTVGGGNDKAGVDGQIALIDDAIKNGVQRFVPSDFGMDYTHISNDELLQSFITDYKVKVDDYLKKVNIPTIRFYQGCIAETLMYILSQGHTFWGDEGLKHDITSYDNTARWVVAAVARPGVTGRLTYSGGKYTAKEIQDTYNKVRGTNVELKRAGSLEDLRNVIETKKKEGDNQTAGFLALLIIMFDKRSKFPETNNKDFPEVKATSLEEFFKENPNVKL